MRKGELVRTVDDWTVFEGIGYRASDQDRVTEHLVGWDGGMEAALRALKHGNVDGGVLQETNMKK